MSAAVGRRTPGASLPTAGELARLAGAVGNRSFARAIQRTIVLRKGDTIESLKSEFPEQADEIAGWDASPITVTYGKLLSEGRHELSFRFTGGSDNLLGFVREISDMFRPGADALARGRPPAAQVLRQLRVSCVQRREDAEQLFRIFLILHTNAGRLTTLLESTHGAWRRRLVEFLKLKLREVAGRPILEGDILDELTATPSAFRGWAEAGWDAVVAAWSTIEPGKRGHFVWDVFDHDKGYNRAINFATPWVIGEGPASQLKTALEEMLRKHRAKTESDWVPPRAQTRAHNQLWIDILGKLMMYRRMQDFGTVEDWRAFFERNAEELESTLAVVGLGRADVAAFLRDGLPQALKVLNAEGDWPASDPEQARRSEFVELRLPEVKPFPKVPGWFPPDPHST